jgi:hypothetical protein
MRATAQSGLELFAESEKSCFPKVSNAQVEFQADAEGKASVSESVRGINMDGQDSQDKERREDGFEIPNPKCFYPDHPVHPC